MSIPITEAIAILSLLGMACSLSWCPLPASLAGGAGARPDHPIKRHAVPALRCGGQSPESGFASSDCPVHRPAANLRNVFQCNDRLAKCARRREAAEGTFLVIAM